MDETNRPKLSNGKIDRRYTVAPEGNGARPHAVHVARFSGEYLGWRETAHGAWAVARVHAMNRQATVTGRPWTYQGRPVAIVALFDRITRIRFLDVEQPGDMGRRPGENHAEYLARIGSYGVVDVASDRVVRS